MTFRNGAVTFERLTLWQKFFRFNWGLALLILAVAAIGFLMLFSVIRKQLIRIPGREVKQLPTGLRVTGVTGNDQHQKKPSDTMNPLI